MAVSERYSRRCSIRMAANVDLVELMVGLDFLAQIPSLEPSSCLALLCNSTVGDTKELSVTGRVEHYDRETKVVRKRLEGVRQFISSC
jgi:hypothetical protein